ncbi:PVC-type heme-binding CxxCH protein [Cyclobacterium xiamenense]|uniref:PVC-type heme-binding CxxCH protein n=1 Tax=Cyclobacterium xiamenense TaxID=1297121 RepID=UPI0035CF8243
MKKLLILVFPLVLWGCGGGKGVEKHQVTEGPVTLLIVRDDASDRLRVLRKDFPDTPLLVQEAQEGFRPYIHPIHSPDGNGILTEYSPGHHRHQTGLYWGFTRINERDFFHHPEESHWKKVAANVLQEEGKIVKWQTVYELLDSLGNAILTETQNWSLQLENERYFLDLEWQGRAEEAVTIGKYDYGGLFLRMPWRKGMEAEVVNTARQKNELAEGQPSMWLNIGMQVEGREDPANVALFDHPDNKGYPQKWRVDGQFGVGPAYTRDADWSLPAGETLILKHRLLFYTDEFDDLALTEAWGEYVGNTGMYNTTALWRIAQEEGKKAKFLSPEEAVEEMTVKEGYRVDVFASEPMITQPMAFCWDDKGRLWAAENRDYESRGHGFSEAGDSRILILEDTDGDGKADLKKVFMEGLAFPAALAVGFDGVFVGAPPNLLFIPDRDQDDRADKDSIEVLLTGWGIRDRHETLNSLHWGPDGWLYGLQGFATPSKIRKPSEKEKNKLYYHKDPFPKNLLDAPGVAINGGVWRYHPVKQKFEVVAHGFSNPWGIDYDPKGQWIMTACVIPHLWHVVQGGIYHRQGGKHFNPYVYEDIKTITDHSHRSAHGGARIYQSDAFPEEEWGRVFMANIHEHAVLTDELVPNGSGFTGKHADDFLLANNAQWVGFSMEIGPDGGVYVLDWHDADICGQEVLHSETGRVFRIMPDQTNAEDWEGRYGDLNSLSDAALVQLQTSKSDWHSRRARGILHKRAVQQKLQQNTVSLLKTIFHHHENGNYRLRALWALHQVDGWQEHERMALLDDADPYVRAWAVQLLCEDQNPPQAAKNRFIQLAREDPSATVRLYLAAALQRIPEDWKWDLSAALMRREEDREDHNLPKMIWFGTEYLIDKNPDRFLAMAEESASPLLTRFMARRAVDGDYLDELVTRIELAEQNKTELLAGMLQGMEGRTDLSPPQRWQEIVEKLKGSGETSRLVAEVSALFGDAVATQEALNRLKDPAVSEPERISALQRLAAQQKAELLPLLPSLLNENSLRLEAIRAVAAFSKADLGAALLKAYPTATAEEKVAILQSLSSRSLYGNQLLDEIKAGNIARKEIPVTLARQLHRVIGSGFVEVWGPIEHVPSDKAAYAYYRDLFTREALSSANLREGKRVFTQSCSSCHKLFGEGADIGPDLTGSNRQDPDYILLNVLEPSAEIQDAYRLVVITTVDGRTYTGNVVGETARQLTLKVAGQGSVLINKSAIQNKEVTDVSLMPPGLFEPLTNQEVINLMAYLQTQKQID